VRAAIGWLLTSVSGSASTRTSGLAGIGVGGGERGGGSVLLTICNCKS
jgi:hypothetical protein